MGEESNERLVGRRIKVLDEPSQDLWIGGVIRGYDLDSGHHLVAYDDGLEVMENLSVAQYELITTTRSLATMGEESNERLVGRRIKVLDDPSQDLWIGGVIRGYDLDSGHHLVAYDDGLEVMENLNVDAVTWKIQVHSHARLPQNAPAQPLAPCLPESDAAPVIPRARGRGKWRRCFECVNCRRADCGSCAECSDKPKFGGPNTRRRPCLLRCCINPLRVSQPSSEQMSAAGSNRGAEQRMSLPQQPPPPPRQPLPLPQQPPPLPQQQPRPLPQHLVRLQFGCNRCENCTPGTRQVRASGECLQPVVITPAVASTCRDAAQTAVTPPPVSIRLEPSCDGHVRLKLGVSPLDMFHRRGLVSLVTRLKEERNLSLPEMLALLGLGHSSDGIRTDHLDAWLHFRVLPQPTRLYDSFRTKLLRIDNHVRAVMVQHASAEPISLGLLAVRSCKKRRRSTDRTTASTKSHKKRGAGGASMAVESETEVGKTQASAAVIVSEGERVKAPAVRGAAAASAAARAARLGGPYPPQPMSRQMLSTEEMQRRQECALRKLQASDGYRL